MKILMLVLVAVVLGCPQTPQKAARPAASISDEAILVTTDFEAEANDAVNEDNYADVLQGIEAAIEAEKAELER